MQVTSIPYTMLLSSTVTGTKGASEGKLAAGTYSKGVVKITRGEDGIT